MGDPDRTRGRWLAVLAAVAVIQGTALVALMARDTAAELPEGYFLGDVRVVDAAGEVRSIAAAAEPTLVLVFHSECVHCATIAPEWARRLAEAPPGLRIVAVSREPHAVASSYARTHGWQVEVLSLEDPEPDFGSPAFELTKRTPWIYGLDASGRIQATGKGAAFARVAAELTSE